jgi:PAS domain S-box-containing protein
LFTKANKPFHTAIKSFSIAIFSKGMVIAWITLIACLFATVGTWYITKSEIEENANEHFTFRINEIKYAIKERMTAYEQILRGGLGLFSVSYSVSRQDWHNYVNSLKINENYPGILGVGFSVFINSKEKEKHIKEIKDQGFPGYKIWPEYEREIYTSIIYLEPFNIVNQRAFGYDMFSEPVRRAAMIQAGDDGKTTVSGKTILVQEAGDKKQAGFLMYLPIYKRNADISTVEKRRSSIIGYIYSPFRMNDLMSGILGEQLPDIHLEIYDGNKVSSESIMYTSLTKDQKSRIGKQPHFKRFTTIDMNGRPWTLSFSSLPSFESTIDKEKPVMILISGFLISFLFFIVARTLTNTYQINRKLEQLLESTMEGIFGIDEEGRCTFINKSALEMLGYKPHELLKKDIHKLIHHSYKDGSPYPEEKCPMLISIKTKEGSLIDNEVFWHSDGTSFPIEYSSYPIKDGPETNGAVITFTNITERKRYLEQIEASLSEKEVLLREIHHRVKNNLQIISSILNLQSGYITDKHSLEVFEESKNRVRSMALIHEKLYQNESLSRLSLKEYVQELVVNLVNSYRRDSKNVESKIEIEEISLATDMAIPLGLIINELVSNSLKYAFPQAREGLIFISITKEENNKYKMIVGDNGVGFPKDFDYKNTNTLGLQLVTSLVSQLNGEIIVNGSPQMDREKKGTVYNIIFRGISE